MLFRSKSKDPVDWTTAAEASLASSVGQAVDDVTRRVIVQGAVTEYLYNELNDANAFKDWYQRNGMR